eukprot:SAG31_NODE_26025_length_450_cov_0.717949_1_plen_138_part_10
METGGTRRGYQSKRHVLVPACRSVHVADLSLCHHSRARFGAAPTVLASRSTASRQPRRQPPPPPCQPQFSLVPVQDIPDSQPASLEALRSPARYATDGMQPPTTQRIAGAPPPPLLRVLVATLICAAAGGGPRPACAS